MILDIFSSFDPALSSIHNHFSRIIFWLRTIFSISLTTSNYWLCPTRISTLTHIPISFMYNQASQTIGTHLKGFSQLISPLFIYVLIINITGILPYTFRLRRHLFFSLSLALPIWIAIIFSSLTHSPLVFIALLLPGHAPNWLNPFLVIIETLRTIVRPLTLSFRLAANISAGHIVLALIGAYSRTILFSSIYLILLFIIFQIGYIMFESAICLIQSYIFCLLLSLYSDDHSISLNSIK
jgi:ATP synthase subunit 6